MVTIVMAGKFKLAFGGIVRSLHQLWLEVTGTFMLVFGVAFGYHAFKEYRKYGESTDNLWWIVAAAGLALLTFGCGVHSFWKARKLR